MDNDELNKGQNNTSPQPNDYQIEIEQNTKESIFDKIKRVLTTPRLGSGDKTHTTNMSFESWERKANFYSSVRKILDSISSIFQPKEPEGNNKLEKFVIGNLQQSVDPTLKSTEKVAEASNIIVPGVVKPKTIINNSTKETAKTPEVGDIEVDSPELEAEAIEVDTTTKEPVQPQHNEIESATITIADGQTQTQTPKENEDHSR